MTLRESELARSRHAQRTHAKQKRRKRCERKNKHPSTLDAPLSMLNDNQVLTFLEWCALNRISARTGRRILNSGRGPTVVQLSTKRIGVTVGANRLWQQSRERA
jgi:hypothetical protein